MKSAINLLLDKWFIRPFTKFLTIGLSSEKLALTFALGTCLGIAPVLGTTTLICTLLAIMFRLNFGAIQLINYMVSPLQLLLIYPFYKLAAFFAGTDIMSGTISGFIERFRIDWWGTISSLGYTAMVAVLIWALISFPFGILLYKVSLPVFKRFAANRNNIIKQ